MQPPSNRSKPPPFAEKLLTWLLTEVDQEAVLGDFAEEYAYLFTHDSQQRAWQWYWLELAKSLPALLQLKRHEVTERTSIMLSSSFATQDKRLMWLGLVTLLPALLIVIPGVLFSVFGIARPMNALDALFIRYTPLELLIHPLLILGGVFVALLLNASAIVRVNLQRETDGLTATIRLKNQLVNWLVVGFGVSLLGIIFIYLLAENFQIFAR